jgi:glycerol kinase
VRVVAQHNVEFPNYTEAAVGFEHDPEEIWTSVGTAVRAAIEKAGDVRIVGVGNHEPARDVALLGSEDGRADPSRAGVAGRRTADRCQALKDQGRESWVRERTASCSTRTSPAPRQRGSSTTSTARGAARSRRAVLRERSTATSRGD